MQKRTNKLLPVSLTAAMIGLSAPVQASDYGTTGLIDIPTARFEADGEFSVSASQDGRHKQYALTYQMTPWLQGTFRYSGFNRGSFWDRNYEVKAKLLDESPLLPQIAVGVRDLVGTGVFGSEYFVASKKHGNTDFTLGLGWGRLAGNGVLGNPLSSVDSRFDTRSNSSDLGGNLSVGSFFSGKTVGFFGGISHSLDIIPVTAMLEYNPDQYDWNLSIGGERPEKPWSIGFTWEVLPGTVLNWSFQHGDQLGVGFRSSLNSKTEYPRREPNKFVSSFYLPPNLLPPQINKKSWYDRLLYDVERSGLLLVEGAISPDGHTAQLVVGNTSYAIWNDAIAMHVALADLHLPATVRSIQYVVEESGHRVATVVCRDPQRQSFLIPIID